MKFQWLAIRKSSKFAAKASGESTKAEAPLGGEEGSLAAETNEPRAVNASDDSMATAVGAPRGGRQLSHGASGSHAECSCYDGYSYTSTWSGGMTVCVRRQQPHRNAMRLSASPHTHPLRSSLCSRCLSCACARLLAVASTLCHPSAPRALSSPSRRRSSPPLHPGRL